MVLEDAVLVVDDVDLEVVAVYGASDCHETSAAS